MNVFTRYLKRKGLYLKFNKYWDIYILLIPVLLYFIIFHYAPLYGLQIAFKRYSPALGIGGSPWIGFDNFTRFFNSFYFERLIRNTIVLSIYSLLASFPIPIILAIMISELRDNPFKKSVQLILYAPRFISIVVIVGILGCMFSLSSGMVNNIMANLGMNRIDFITEAPYFKHMYVWSGVWQNSGWSSIIFVAAIAGIDSEIYEAATVDGASRIKRILYITLPCLIPTIITMFLLNLGQIMNIGFEKVYLMQYPMNMETSDVISTFVYRSGIVQGEYGFATAVGLFNNVINFALIYIANKITSKMSQTSFW